jgi:hypothetical protein
MNPILKLAACMIALVARVAAASAGEPPASHASKSFDFLGSQMTILVAGTDTGGSSALKRGTFQFFMDGICLQAGPGATVYMPKGHTHGFKNISKRAGEQLMFVYPAGLDQFFLDVHNLDLKMPRDFDKLNELSNSKYGINHLPGHDFHAGACTVVTASSASAK